MYSFWFKKPYDVEEPIDISTDGFRPALAYMVAVSKFNTTEATPNVIDFQAKDNKRPAMTTYFTRQYLKSISATSRHLRNTASIHIDHDNGETHLGPPTYKNDAIDKSYDTNYLCRRKRNWPELTDMIH